PKKYKDICGYTDPNESEHDFFKVGHTATSISLAVGLAKGRDLNGGKENIIAIIGDGSLSGGEAYEGLNNAAELNSNMIIIVNDNDMSIAPVYGGYAKNLALLRQTNGQAENNIFKALGFEYEYIDNGNDLDVLIPVFQQVKDINHPVVVHIHTQKGYGLKPAMENKEYWHWSAPGDVEGIKEKSFVENYNHLTSQYLIDKCQKDKKVLVISPATPSATGLTPDVREKLGSQFIDVGIAEEHAIAYASGIAKNGGKPVVEIMSSFLQRTYDQLSQDLALNHNPATILVFASGISGGDATHLGTFDIPLASNIPNLLYLQPTSQEEYLDMLDWSIEQKELSVMIRVPTGPIIHKPSVFDKQNINQYKIEEHGEKVAIIGIGSFFEKAKAIKETLNMNVTLINPLQVTTLDTDTLESLKENHDLVVVLENGSLEGGFGEKIARYYGNSDMKVLCYGSEKEFSDRVSLDVLNKKYRLNNDLIVKDILKNIK
ncbi:MAG: 1-deoxy-D-xylulose-5-phosphate synthase, partial [Faecalibacillus sp.]